MNKKPIVVLLAAALSPMASAVLAAEDAVDIPRLVVTSDPLGNRTSDELIQPVTVIAGDELNQKRASTIGETLDGLPGVHNADFGQGVGRPVVRGLQGSRVKVLEDGLSTSDISGEGADHAIGMDAGRADQIEVFRGPATLLYGSGAAGGVINVRSNRFNPEFGDDPRDAWDLNCHWGTVLYCARTMGFVAAVILILMVISKKTSRLVVKTNCKTVK